jgi:Flp pilus assembly secretin CpaC
LGIVIFMGPLAMPRQFGLLIGAVIVVGATAAVAATGDMTVQLKESRRVGLNGSVANVVVSDPSVADVAMVDPHSVVVLGKGYGSSTVLILDHNGRALLDSRITVVAPDDGRVTVFRGAVATEFACAPRCQPASGGGGTPGAVSPAGTP